MKHNVLGTAMLMRTHKICFLMRNKENIWIFLLFRTMVTYLDQTAHKNFAILRLEVGGFLSVYFIFPEC